MRFGLALCAHTMSSNDENDELFFAAINQINRGGESVVQEGCQKDVLARLNLKAGKRAINLSDYRYLPSISPSGFIDMDFFRLN